MNRRTFTASLVAAPIAIGGVLQATAQTPSALEGALPGVGQLKGVQGAVARIWGLDIDAELQASPGASPLDFLHALTMLNATVMEFDTADSAAEALSTYAAGIGGQLQLMGQGGTPTVTESELSDVGDEATSATLETVSGDFATYYRFDLVRKDTMFFLVSGLAGAEDAMTRVDDLARWLAENGKKDGDAAIFVAEGGSTGGLWGYMPLDVDPVVSPLVSISDETLFNEYHHSGSGRETSSWSGTAPSFFSSRCWRSWQAGRPPPRKGPARRWKMFGSGMGSSRWWCAATGRTLLP